MYTPRGILAHRVDIPTVPQKPSGGLSPTKLWTTELLNEKTITSRLESLLDNPHKTLQSLGEVLLLLDFSKRRLFSKPVDDIHLTCLNHQGLDNGQTQIISKPVWPERSSDFDKFALTVLQYVVCTLSCIVFVGRYADPVHSRSWLYCPRGASYDCKECPRRHIARPQSLRFPESALHCTILGEAPRSPTTVYCPRRGDSSSRGRSGQGPHES